MEFYVASNGEKLGPLTIYRVVDLLRDKAISPADKAWTRDQEGGWKPLEEIPAFDSAIRDLKREEREEKLGPEITADEMRSHEQMREAERAAGKIRIAQEVQPFPRFWGRMFDYTLVMIGILLYTNIPIPEAPTSINEFFSLFWSKGEEYERLAMVVMWGTVIWTLAESVLIWLFGTTPGKMLFGMRVTTEDGNPVPLFRSVGRSLFVLLIGCGLYHPILFVIGATYGFIRLLATGRAPWDQKLKLKVHHAPMGLVRILLAVGGFFALVSAVQHLNT